MLSQLHGRTGFIGSGAGDSDQDTFVILKQAHDMILQVEQLTVLNRLPGISIAESPHTFPGKDGFCIINAALKFVS